MGMRLEFYSEETAQRIAKIIGPFSAAAAALRDLSERRTRGEDVSLYIAKDGAFVVGPTAKFEE